MKGSFHSWQGERERKLRGPGNQKKGWPNMWTKEERAKRGEEGTEGADRGERGGRIRGFAGAAWTTSDLNGALNPAVAYPDFSSIPLTPSTAQQTGCSTLVPTTRSEYNSVGIRDEERKRDWQRQSDGKGDTWSSSAEIGVTRWLHPQSRDKRHR